jgi:hypothetical protein
MDDRQATVDTLLSTPATPKVNLGAVETSRGITEMKYVFVCGMPRSGTTIVAKEIARLTNCTGFENTRVMMDEGQYLQDVYPTELVCGGAGRFGFAAEAHLTEDSPLLTPTNVARLHKSWEAYWDRDKTIRVEKTPGNLLKTRFLQAAFPNAHFIVVKRHPVPVSLATQKWSLTPLHELFAHWLHCYKLFDEDKKQLNRLFELSYESYIENPGNYLEKIANFVGTEFSGSLKEQVTDGYDKKYFDRWARMLESSPFKSYYRHIAKEYEREFREQGYSLESSHPRARFSLDQHKPVRGILPPLLYLGAASFFALWRAGRWLRIRIENAAVIRPLILSVKRAIRQDNS